MQVLKTGSFGGEVTDWQHFLIGRQLYAGVASGSYDTATQAATQAFQRRYAIPADGIVGRGTYAKAIELGFGVVKDTGEAGPDWPARPDMLVPTQAVRERMFGRFKFVADPQPGNPEKIKLLDDWVHQNLIDLAIPQLVGVKGFPASGRVTFHKKVAPRVTQLVAAWEAEGLLPLILTWNGSYAARYVRGSQSTLSAHAFGSAFDLNVAQNPLGAVGALVGETGSNRKLAEVALKYGFYWGFWFTRKDPMHFELAK